MADLGQSLDSITSEHGGYLRCETCGHSEVVQSSYWRWGWPKHCGYTMRWWTARQIAAGEVHALAGEGR